MTFALRIGRAIALAAGLAAAFAQSPAAAGTASIAVAANFTEVANEIGRLFREKTGHEAVFSFGSTGGLYTQISQGAPFEVFLAADSARPAQAVSDGFAVPDSLFTYAVGKLAVFSADATRPVDEAALRTDDFRMVAIANPATAPYGAAALATLRALGIHGAIAPKLVRGESITQAFQFVETGNAELGFVALSQIARREGGSRWIVPDHLYPPIFQDAVLLKSGATNAAATAFIAFLRGPEAAAIIRSFGYGIAD